MLNGLMKRFINQTSILAFSSFAEKAKRDYGKFTVNSLERPILITASQVGIIFFLNFGYIFNS